MVLALADQMLSCLDCDAVFVFSVAEQAFYAERRLPTPSRCPDCRARRRAERNVEVIKARETALTAIVSQDGHGCYAGSAGKNGGPRRGARSGFRAICSACGRDADVPFDPRPGRPVFCRACFDQRRGR